MKKILLLATLFCPALFTIGGNAQETGSFTETITFMDESRSLACYVPESYDPAVPARLIIALHGLGDNGTNYRNAWVSGLDFADHITNTILICPDGGSDFNSDFYVPAGDEGIIQASIDFAKAGYNIDTTNIILQGFSLGGARALQYGLAHTDMFKGLLLNTPAIQGVKDAVTAYADGGLYAYDNAPEIPVYITHGSADELYMAPIDSMYEQMVKHNGMVRLVRFPIGHTIPDLEDFEEFDPFFETLFLDDYDAELVKVNTKPRTCETGTIASVLVQNKGAQTLSSIKMHYSWDGTDHPFTWSGTLEPFQHADITLPVITAADGNYMLTVTIDSINSLADVVEVNDNNKDSAAFRIMTDSQPLPYTQKFDDESYDNTWLTLPSGDYLLPFSYDDETQAVVTLNTIFIFDNSGRKEEIASPVLDLTSLENPFVSFDVAYSYIRYTEDLLGVDTLFADTLEVLVSTDCGATFTSVYKKGGEDLLTFPLPLENPLSLDECFITPDEESWRREQIDLSSFAASEEAVVKFSYKSALGGIIYLDNIAFVNEATGMKQVNKLEAKVYPNPVSERLTVDAGNETIKTIAVFDITGRKVTEAGYNNVSRVEIPVSGLINGVYMLEITGDKGSAMQKVAVKH